MSRTLSELRAGCSEYYLANDLLRRPISTTLGTLYNKKVINKTLSVLNGEHNAVKKILKL